GRSRCRARVRLRTAGWHCLWCAVSRRAGSRAGVVVAAAASAGAHGLCSQVCAVVRRVCRGASCVQWCVVCAACSACLPLYPPPISHGLSLSLSPFLFLFPFVSCFFSSLPVPLLLLLLRPSCSWMWRRAARWKQSPRSLSPLRSISRCFPRPLLLLLRRCSP